MAAQVFLDKYEVIRPLGEGSMGRVVLARQRDNDREVVIKVMHEQIAQQPMFRDAFRREMALLGQLQHPNVVAFYEASDNDPAGPCIVMEYVQGSDLEQMLQIQKQLTPGQVGWLLGQLCSALQTAHSLGIIHRDLKPANLMIVDAGSPQQTLKVMDFGLATLSNAVYISLDKLRGEADITACGTPEYMPPEQIRGDEIDPRSDLYSVGVMLFEFLTGKLPFDRPSIPELFQAHVEDPPPTFASLGVTDVRPALESVVQQCLSKFPVERPRDAFDLAQRFGVALGHKILDQISPTASGALTRNDLAPALPPVDPNAMVRELDAYMPERIAVVKLRGFVEDVGGELVESIPGLIRVRFSGRECRYHIPTRSGPLSWLGLGTKGAKGIDLDLRMEKSSSQSAELHVTLVLRPSGGLPMPEDPAWHLCCDRIYRDLKGYLMGK
ncbi:MAG: serine/threonine protein kinase [Gemmataceae bacterium]|nr:serine/threonine protein kinase [Gemmataceae bacterium]